MATKCAATVTLHSSTHLGFVQSYLTEENGAKEMIVLANEVESSGKQLQHFFFFSISAETSIRGELGKILLSCIAATAGNMTPSREIASVLDVFLIT